MEMEWIEEQRWLLSFSSSSVYILSFVISFLYDDNNNNNNVVAGASADIKEWDEME